MDARKRFAISACLILATLMQALDLTIANVSLPYMQGSVSASQDEIAWVLTSYIVASAIMTPPAGFFATRFGIKRVVQVSITGFIIASMLCGAAQTLPQIILFRCLQGAFGAAIGPLTQATLFNINPPERQARALSIFGIAVMAAPVLGPVLGGLLTSDYSWRAVFYINVPLGGLALIGVFIFLPESKVSSGSKLDWFGFGSLSLAIGALQILLDRGTEQDWFSSREIIVEAVLAGIAFYLFLVHIFTARTPFIRPVLFTDRNFTAGMLCITGVGITSYAALSLQPPFLQGLMGDPIVTAGMIMGPRGVGTVVSMLVTGRLVGRVDNRIMIGTGLITMAWSFYAMSHWTLDVSNITILSVGMVQGLGQGIVFSPVTALSLSTVVPEHRPEAAGVYNVARTMGSSVGISMVNSLLTRNAQVNHADIATYVTIFNRQLNSPHVAAFWSPLTTGGAAALDAVINQQAQVIAYTDDYKLLMVLTLCMLPLLFVIKAPAPRRKASTVAAE